MLAFSNISEPDGLFLLKSGYTEVLQSPAGQNISVRFSPMIFAVRHETHLIPELHIFHTQFSSGFYVTTYLGCCYSWLDIPLFITLGYMFYETMRIFLTKCIHDIPRVTLYDQCVITFSEN